MIFSGLRPTHFWMLIFYAVVASGEAAISSGSQPAQGARAMSIRCREPLLPLTHSANFAVRYHMTTCTLPI